MYGYVCVYVCAGVNVASPLSAPVEGFAADEEVSLLGMTVQRNVFLFTIIACVVVRTVTCYEPSRIVVRPD